MSLALSLIIFAFLVAVQAAIPFLVKRTVVFGVTIPEQHIQNEKLVLYKKSYTRSILLTALLLIGIYLIWSLTANPTEEFIVLVGVIIQFGLMLISISLYFYYHGKTIQVKKAEKFTEDLKQVKVTDLTIRSQDEMLPWYLYLLPIIVTAGLMGYTLLQYEILPEQIPTHWGINGEADAFTEKTPFSVISMSLILFVIQLMLLGINIATKKSGIKLSATTTNASKIRQLSLRKYSSWFTFLTVVLITFMFSYFQLNTIHPSLFSNHSILAAPLIFMIVILVGSIVFAVKVGRADKQVLDQPTEHITDIDEDAYWKGGLFYFNRNDPSILVEKRFGVGWTLNFANPLGYLIVIVPLIIVLLISFL